MTFLKRHNCTIKKWQFELNASVEWKLSIYPVIGNQQHSLGPFVNTTQTQISMLSSVDLQSVCIQKGISTCIQNIKSTVSSRQLFLSGAFTCRYPMTCTTAIHSNIPTCVVKPFSSFRGSISSEYLRDYVSSPSDWFSVSL